MKKLIYLPFYLLILCFTVSCNKCEKGSGNVTNMERSVGEFSGVQLDGSSNVHIIKDSIFKVIVITDDNIQPYLQTTVLNDQLIIDFKSGQCTRNVKKMEVQVYTPVISNIRLKGSGNITMDGQFKGDRLEANLDGSGNIDVNFEGKTVNLKLSGSGNINLQGNSEVMDINLNGSGNVEAITHESKSVSVRLDGSGNINVFATASLNANISGSGNIVYRGEPASLQKTITGSGSVIKN